MRWRFKIALILLLFTSLYMPTFFNSVSSKESIIDTRAELRIAVIDSINGLNPLEDYSSHSAEDFILSLLFSSLFTKNPLNYYNVEDQIPWTVDSYTYTVDENSSYLIIKLKGDIYFHDGTPVTAEDLAFTYEFLKWLGSENYRFYDFYRIILNVTVIDNLTVRIDLGTSAILDSIEAVSVWIFPRKIYGAAETWDSPDDNRTFIGEFPYWNVTVDAVVNYLAMNFNDPILLGSGPFRPLSNENQTLYKPSVLILERNPYYFRKAVNISGDIIHPWINWSDMNPDNPELFGPYVERLKLVFFDNLESAFEALKRGDVDLVGFYYNKTIAEKATQEGLRVVLSDYLIVRGLFFRMSSSSYIYNDRRFRLSIAYILNKTAIAEAEDRYEAIPTDYFVPPQYGDWSPVYEGPNFIDRNMTMANALLSELNISDYDGDGFLEWNASDNNSDVGFSIGVYSESDLEFVNKTIVSQLRAAGIKAKAVLINFESLCLEDYDLVWLTFYIGVPPVSIFAGINIFSMLWNLQNSTFTSIIEDLFESRNWTELKERLNIANRIAWQEQIFIPIYNIKVFGMYKSPDESEPIEGVYPIPDRALLNFYTALRTVKYTTPQNNTESTGNTLNAENTNYTAELLYAGLGVAIILVIAMVGIILRKGKH